MPDPRFAGLHQWGPSDFLDGGSAVSRPGRRP